jgi:hypothetical protein
VSRLFFFIIIPTFSPKNLGIYEEKSYFCITNQLNVLKGDGYETGRRQVSTATELPLEEIQKMRE